MLPVLGLAFSPTLLSSPQWLSLMWPCWRIPSFLYLTSYAGSKLQLIKDSCFFPVLPSGPKWAIYPVFVFSLWGISVLSPYLWYTFLVHLELNGSKAGSGTCSLIGFMSGLIGRGPAVSWRDPYIPNYKGYTLTDWLIFYILFKIFK